MIAIHAVSNKLPTLSANHIFHSYQPPRDLLKNRVVLITGAGSGIGKTASLACAAHGATVVLLGSMGRSLEIVYDAIENAGNPTPAMYVLDLEHAEPNDYTGLANSLAQEFGRLDGLLHNAAVLPFLSRIDDYEPQAWQQVIQTNLTAPFLLTQACLPLLRNAADASILFTSDEAGRTGRAYWGAYAVAKFGIEGLMQVLADELSVSTAIRVNSIDPGPVRTNMRMRVYPGRNPSDWPLPEQIMPAYLYLLGPESRGITGHALNAQ